MGKLGSLLVKAIKSLQPKEAAVSDIPPEFVCPITHELMREPVIAFDGCTYEKVAIEEYLEEHKKSPVTGAEASMTVVFPNNHLKALITAYFEAERMAEDDQEGDEETLLLI